MAHTKDLNLQKIDVTKTKHIYTGFLLVGLVLSFLGYRQEDGSFWQAYLINYFL